VHPGASVLDRPASVPSRARLDRRAVPLLLLLLCSGAAALTYQVLWVRELGLLFGSTAQAAALAIAIFFSGLAAGGAVFGHLAARVARPLRAFGLLELAVAVTALAYFGLVAAVEGALPTLELTAAAGAASDTLLRAGVATLVLFPPAFLMGGTLPMAVQHAVERSEDLAVTGSALYAVNTTGSAIGALAAGTVLPLALGFRGAYLAAVATDAAVAAAALALSHRRERGELPATSVSTRPATPTTAASTTPAGSPPTGAAPSEPAVLLPWPLVLTIAAVSGVATLGVEVLWTRQFSQVLQNSTYTYALVLTTFLVALALGSLVANVLARLRRPEPVTILAGLLAASALAAAVSPWLLHGTTDGLSYVGADLGWTSYLVAVSGVAAVAMLLPAVLLGAVLPYLLRVVQRAGSAPGRTVGTLLAVNTAGGIVGALLAGFVLLPTLGAWRSLLLLASTYLLCLGALLWTRRVGLPVGARLVVAGAALGAVAATLVVPLDLTVLRYGDGPGQRVVEVREGTAATVAVTGSYDDLAIRVDNHYVLGSTRGLASERNQAVVPLLAHPDARSVFFLGLGTGITAGASLPFELDRVVACELLDDVVDASRDHFGPWTNGLFDDPRATVLAEDGRACLRRTEERFDLIVSDLFTPWHAGTGNLYTLEHYRTARERLTPGGAYVQWVPLYQVSERELAIIAATMQDAFEQVTVWRGDLFSERSIVALVGHDDDAPLVPGAAARRGTEVARAARFSDAELDAMLLRFYVGNATAAGAFADAPRNTDDRPLVERLAPRTHREVRTGDASFVTGDERERLYAALRDALPPAEDPYLRDLDARSLAEVEAGHALSLARWLEADGDGTGAAAARAAFERASPRLGELPSPAAALLPRER
jgi:spermidine synthase